MTDRERMCTRCILDAGVPRISFDSRGVCNYCHLHDTMDALHPMGKAGGERLAKIAGAIKRKGAGKAYDCVVGVSGGADSTYTLSLVKRLGLRPLAVHLDNGWDTEIAVANIKNVTEHLGVDLHTLVLDWEEFKDLQIAFLRSGTPDVEAPTDLAIVATLWRVADAEGIRYVINGHSFRTEGKIPLEWSYCDRRYLEDVHRRFGKCKVLRTYPQLSLRDYAYYGFVKQMREVRPLYFVDYRRESVLAMLRDELGWREYDIKHHESTYTRFAQAYWLPRKFKIDKRRVHYSAQVRSGHLSREEALAKVAKPPLSEAQEKELGEYVRSKLGLSHEEMHGLFLAENKSFHDYPNDLALVQLARIPLRWFFGFVSPTTPQLLVGLRDVGRKEYPLKVPDINVNKRKLKICYVVSAKDIHGQRWIRYSQEQGHEVIVVTSRPHGGLGVKEYPLKWGIPLPGRYAESPFRAALSPFSVRQLKGILERERPDIVHAYYASHYGFLTAAADYHPFLLTALGSDILLNPKSKIRILRSMVRYALEKADGITCDADHMIGAMVQLGAEREKIDLVYFGTDVQRFKPADGNGTLREKLGTSGSPTVISLRNLTPLYDVESLVRAVPLILKEVSQAKLIVVGDGPHRADLEQLAASLGVSGSVRFVGWVPNIDLPGYLTSSDVYVSTSLSDAGLAASTAEAMACGLPVVITDFGDNRKWVEDGVSGFLVPLRNPEALAARIVHLLRDRQRREEFGKRGRAVIEERNNFYKEMAKMVGIYERLVQEHRQ